MIILDAIGYIGLKNGGPVEALRMIAEEQNKLGHKVLANRLIGIFKN